MQGLTRRGILTAGGVLACSLPLWRAGGHPAFAALSTAAAPVPGQTRSFAMIAAERPTALPCFGGLTLPLWTFSDATWLPVVRVSLGDRVEAVLDNRLARLDEHTSIHWHGIRLPNDQDGIPYLTQPPVKPGETFRYAFVPPDTGTFFFHPHCNSVEQIGRGLFGILIVDGDTTEPYAADETILLRDWLVDAETGSFRNFMTKRGAARAGTFGNVRSANGSAEATLRLPAAADCRLRLINGDPTRVMEIAVVGADAAVIATDGIAVPPFPLDSWLLAPAMRLDLVIRSPGDGGAATLVDRRGETPLSLVRLIGAGESRETTAFAPRPLRAGRIPEPDLAAAERLSFVFASGAPVTAAADDPAAAFLGPICRSVEDFWTINGTAWPGDGQSKVPPPIAALRLGGSYVFTLKNASKLMHPVHIHGHTFKVLSSNQRSLPIHYADTVLLQPDETVEVAFVADNPGDWMFHCHVIEHQETGMMAYLSVA